MVVKFNPVLGHQWTIRLEACQAIRVAFDRIGLSFAVRSGKVEVVGDGNVSHDALAGAAQDAIDGQLDQAPKPIDNAPTKMLSGKKSSR